MVAEPLASDANQGVAPLGVQALLLVLLEEAVDPISVKPAGELAPVPQGLLRLRDAGAGRGR